MNIRYYMPVIMFLSIVATPGISDNIYVDLSQLFNTDAFMASDTALGDSLNGSGNWLDISTLPEDYLDGKPYATLDGLSAFRYGNLSGSGLDSLRMDGQSFDVPAGQYDRLQLALLSTDAFLDLGRFLTFHYADGSSQQTALGPLANWFDSPARYCDSYFSWTDKSGINEVLNIHLQVDDQPYIVESTGSSLEPRSDYRFVDASGVLTYEFDFDDNITDLTMGIEMSNNFVVGISTDLGDNYVEVLNSQAMFGEDIHNGSNRRIYEVDLAPYLAEYPDRMFRLRFTDGTTNNGWGPSIWNIFFYTGKTKFYEGYQVTPLDLNKATVYANFRADGGAEEAKYLIEDNGTSLSSTKHRYADKTASFVYAFDLPDDVSDVKAALTIDADFSISVTNERKLIVPADFVPGGTRDAEYIYENNDSNDAGTYRFCDGSRYIVYVFDIPPEVTESTLQMELENNFIVSVGSAPESLEVVLNSQEMYGSDIHNASNRKFYEVELGKYLQNNPTRKIYLKFEDGSINDGWGPAMRRIKIVSGEEPVYTPVLDTIDAFADTPMGYVTRNANKYVAILDLSSFLQNNPKKELYIRIADNTPEGGWGPGLYRLVLYSGEAISRADGFCMSGLYVTGTAPTNISPWGVNLTRREFAVDSAKTLQSVTLPELNDNQKVYLFAATLEGGSTSVPEWSLF